MRKIASKTEEDKKKRRTKFIVGGILVFLMVASTLGYAFQGNTDSSTNNEITYNGYKFVSQSGYWALQMGNYLFRFSNTPQDVENLTGNFNLISSYYDKPLYISSEDGVSENEIYVNLDQVIQRRQYACLDGENCTGELPVKKCTDNFIIIRRANLSSVIQQDNCVFISGPAEDLIKQTDAFIYKIIGVK